MLIEIFGPGCTRCETLTRHTQDAVQRLGGDHQIVKISDYALMASRGVLATPALAVDGQLKFQGKVPTSEEIFALLQA